LIELILFIEKIIVFNPWPRGYFYFRAEVDAETTGIRPPQKTQATESPLFKATF
jgi:hypothetical protein